MTVIEQYSSDTRNVDNYDSVPQIDMLALSAWETLHFSNAAFGILFLGHTGNPDVTRKSNIRIFQYYDELSTS
jgi:hypothetical protein